jgi:hypothetical protein
LQLAYLETDASVATQSPIPTPDGRRFSAGGGIVIRDLLLRPVLLKSVPLTLVPGPLHAEYLALTEGLQEASKLGAKGVWATTDSERLAEAFNGRSSNRSPGLPAILQHLETVRARFEFVTLRWSRGSHRRTKLGGPTADSLARAAIGLGRRK